MAMVSPARCAALIGRAAELRAIDDLLVTCQATGAALAFVGEAGVGKSRLVREALDRAQGSGFAASVGRASPTAHAPFRPCAEVLLGLSRRAGPPRSPELVPYLSLLGWIVPEWRTDSDPVEQSSVLFAEAVVRALSALATGNGQLVVLEDLHWADAQTLAAVEYLVDNASDTRSAIVVTARPGSDAASVIDRLSRRGALRSVDVRALPDADAAAVVRGCVTSGDQLPQAVVASVTLAAAGIPLLLEDLTAHALAGDGRGVPTRYADSVGQRLRDLGADARVLVEMAALIGLRVEPTILASVDGASPASVRDLLGSAVAAQLLVSTEGGFAFRHALTREAVVATMAAADRRRLARSAAAALDPVTGVDRPMVASLWDAAGEPARAAAALHEAGRECLERAAFDTAITMLRRSAALDPNAERTRSLLVTALARSGDVAAALVAGNELLAWPGHLDLESTRELHLVLARAACDAGRADQARRHLADARLGADAAQRSRAAAIEARLAMASIGDDRLVAGEHLAQAAATSAARAGDSAVLCDALEILGRCRRVRDLHAATEAFEESYATAVTHGLAWHRIQALNELGTIDMFTTLDPARLIAAHEAAASTGALSMVAATDVNLAALFTMTGDYARAQRHAESACEIGARFGLPGVAASGQLFVAVIAVHCGRFADMRTAVAAAEAAAGGDPDVLVGTWAMCRAIASLLREDRARADQEFQHAATLLIDQPVLAIDPLRGPWLLLRALDGRASLDDVRAFEDSAARGARWSQLWGGLARAVVEGSGGRDVAAGAAARSALKLGQPMPLFRAIGARMMAEAAVRDGWGEPEQWLADAAEVFAERGHDRPAAACRDLLRRSGVRVGRDRRVDRAVRSDLRSRGVTAREAQVLALLADRLTNREIAARLYVSPRTVEKHVAALLMKTGVSARTDLVFVWQEATYLG